MAGSHLDGAAEARDLYGCDLALVRPDQYVAWRGNALSADPDKLMARVTGSIKRCTSW